MDDDNESFKDKRDFEIETTGERQSVGNDESLQNTPISSDHCNLIVNYLPPDFDDNNLKVKI